MATAHFFGSYPPTRGLSPFNPYTKNVELKSSFHPRSRNNTGKKPSYHTRTRINQKPSHHSEVPKQYGQNFKTLTSFRGPETIRAKLQNPHNYSEVPKQYGQNNHSEVPKQYGQKRQNPHFIRGPETGIQSPGTLPIFPIGVFYRFNEAG